MITFKQTQCPEYKPSRCPTYKLKALDCTNEPQDDTPPLDCGTPVYNYGSGHVTAPDPNNDRQKIALTGMGTATLTYNVFGYFDAAAKFQIFINGVLVATTVNEVGTSGTLSFYYSGGECTVLVTVSNRALWNYILGCVQ